MANDITKAISANNIKNGTIVVTCGVTGFPDAGSITNDTYVSNSPTLADIQSKYDNKFDNPSYYYGTGNVDGGNV